MFSIAKFLYHLHGRIVSCLAPADLLALGATLFACVAAPANEAPSLAADLARLSLEDLGQIQVTSVSRKSESLSTAAAAIHVVTQEDIRRSGVNSLPEALRMVPGMEVAQANSHQWAISVRGFNSVFANKLLVLMDGRTLYTPAFSGVYWEETDTVLEDIDRIEVIRGPGATLWGANAVNGVINIVTKSAKETQGVLISGGGGLEERGFGTVRYGGQLATNVHYRVYGKHFDRDEFTLTDGSGAEDSWWKSQGGFRVDWDASTANRLTLQGDYSYGELNGYVLRHSLSPVGMFPARYKAESEGANLLGRWTHQFSEESDLSAQVYFDRTDRLWGNGHEIRDTVDLDTQHRFQLGPRNEIVWGGGYRYSADDNAQSPDYFTAEPRVGLQLFSAFVQDEIGLIAERLRLTAGTKIEHNDFTGFEVQPSGRIAWTPHERHTVWAAVSRAVRTPSRSERGFGLYIDPPVPVVGLPVPILVRVMGNPDFGSEDMLAYELGYRVKPHDRLTLDVAAFYNQYDHLASALILPAELRLTPTPHLLIPGTYENSLFGESYGGEVAAVWQPLEAWRIRASYSLLKLNLHTRGPVPSISEVMERDDPQQQVFLWSEMDLGKKMELGLGFRYVDDRRDIRVPNYTALDASLTWKATRHCDVTITGRNLLDPHHREGAPPALSLKNVDVDRAVYAKLTLRF